MERPLLTGSPAQPNPSVLRHQMGISRERMARLLDLSTRTVERIEGRNRLPTGTGATARLVQLQQIVELGLAVYTPEGFMHFVATPLATFGGRTALQLIERGEGAQVLGVLATDYEGAPT